jgi:hypothetical protein
VDNRRKTELMKNLMLQDAQQGHNFAFIDPHSDAATEMLGLIPKDRVDDVIYFDPSDPNSPSFNPLALPYPPHKIVLDLLSIFKMFYSDSWSTPQEHIMRSVLLTLLLDSKPHCLADVKRILSEPEYRNTIDIHSDVRSFWEVEFDRLPKTSIQSLTNKLSLILMPGSPQQRIFSAVQNDLNFKEITDGKILICNLAKGTLGEATAHLIGGFLVAGLQQAALDRVNQKRDDRKAFYLYVDEFQNFTVNSFNSILTESPKYKMYLTMAHQFMHQLPEDLRSAISGTVGTRVAFQIADEDASKVKSLMSVNRMLWRKGGEWLPIMTFKDYAVEVLSAPAESLRADYEKLLRKAQTAFTPTQLREIAKSYIDYETSAGVKKRKFIFENIDFEQEEFPEKYELQNLPKYTAFVRLGSNQNVYRIQTIKARSLMSSSRTTYY